MSLSAVTNLGQLVAYVQPLLESMNSDANVACPTRETLECIRQHVKPTEILSGSAIDQLPITDTAKAALVFEQWVATHGDYFVMKGLYAANVGEVLESIVKEDKAKKPAYPTWLDAPITWVEATTEKLTVSGHALSAISATGITAVGPVGTERFLVDAILSVRSREAGFNTQLIIERQSVTFSRDELAVDLEKLPTLLLFSLRDQLGTLIGQEVDGFVLSALREQLAEGTPLGRLVAASKKRMDEILATRQEGHAERLAELIKALDANSSLTGRIDPRLVNAAARAQEATP